MTHCTLFLRYEQKKGNEFELFNRQKTLKVRFCDQQDRMRFFKSKRHLRTGLIYLQLKATSLSTVQVRYCKSAYGGSLTEVDGKGLVFINR